MRYLLTLFLVVLLAGASAENLLSVTQQAVRFDPVYLKAKADNLVLAQALPLARAKFLPSLALTASTNKSYLSDGETSGQSVGLGLSQTLFNPSDMLAMRSAMNQASAAQLSTYSSFQNLLGRVTKAYFQLAYTERYLQLLDEQSKASHRLWQQAKSRYQAGQTTLNDVLAAKASYSAAQATHSNQMIVLASDRAALEQLTNKPIKRVDGINRHFRLRPPEPASLSQWIAYAMQHNPSLAAAKKDLLAARSDIDASEAEHLPSIKADVDYNANHGHTYGVSGGDHGTTVGLSLNLPLFSGGAMLADTQSKRYAYTASSESMANIHAILSATIKSSYMGIVRGITEVRALETSLAAQEKAYQTSLLTYRGGLATMQDVLSAQNSLYAAKSSLLQAQYGYLNNIVLLKQAAGFLSLNDIALLNRWLS